MQPVIHAHTYTTCVVVHCPPRPWAYEFGPGLVSIRLRLAGPSARSLTNESVRQPRPLPSPSPCRCRATCRFPHSLTGTSRCPIAQVLAQTRDVRRVLLGLCDGLLHGQGMASQLLALRLVGPLCGVRGLPLGGRRHRRALLDRRAPGRYYAVDDVPLQLGRPPARAYAHDVADAQGVLWVVDQVALELLEVLQREKGG